jgi:hypothetical protein
MLFRLRRELVTARFNLGVRGIRSTPPMACDPHSRLVLVTQLCHRDVSMYLLAIKSLTRFIRPKRVFILDDMSLTDRDKALLRHHVQSIAIVPITSVENTACPKGSCWERLLFISDLAPSDYIVQLDSDTLTLRSPRDVLTCLKSNTSFTLAGDPGEDIVSAQEMSRRMKPQVRNGTEHVQLVAEASLDRVPSEKPLRYVRGCAAFAGFGKDSFSRKTVEHLSTSVASTIGQAKWSEWGSEQVASCLVVANTPGAVVLPFSDYCYHRPELEMDDRTFIHFMGTYRFRLGRYSQLARRVIRELAAKKS